MAMEEQEAVVSPLHGAAMQECRRRHGGVEVLATP